MTRNPLYYNSRQRVLEQIAEYNFATTQDSMQIRVVPGQAIDTWDGKGICAFAVAKGRSVLATDVTTDSRYAAVVDEQVGETLSELAVPVFDKAQVVGVLNLESSSLGECAVEQRPMN